MYINVNPNPLGKQAGDCVVRALAIATKQSWLKTYDELCDEGRRQADMPSSNAVWGAVLKKKGFRMRVLPDKCPECVTIRAFCRMYPDGIYVVGTGSHACAVVYGDYMDAWDSGGETVTYFWGNEDV